MTSLQLLSNYGREFQSKVIGLLLTDKEFLLERVDSLDIEYFDNTAHNWIIKQLKSYYQKYHTFPTKSVLAIEVKRLEGEEVLKIAITEQLKLAYYAIDESKDLDFVKQEFGTFCTNQQMKKAILASVDLLNVGDFEGIKQMIYAAMKSNEVKNIGHEYEKDVESRYREDDRRPVPWPWPVFNDLTQGGSGKGDLVIIFGSPGGGKSWTVVDYGAFAATLGYNVVHYTLELAEGYVGKRYDAALSRIAVDKLKDHQSEIEEMVKGIKGKIIIKEYAPKRASIRTIENHIEQLKNQYDFIPDLIIIDYLDLLKSKTVRKDVKEELDDNYVDAKGLARELQIPIISPSQANRAGAKSTILEGEHAAGSYNKIMISDLCISLSRSRKQKLAGTGIFHVIKNRFGRDSESYFCNMDTSTGYIEINPTPIDVEDNEEGKGYNDPSNLIKEEKEYLQSKFELLQENLNKLNNK